MDLPAALALTASLWLSLPHGDSVSDLLETVVPFTFTDAMNTGGVISGKPSLTGADGLSWGGTTYAIGPLDITNSAVGGTPLMYPDLSMFEQVHITEAAAPTDRASPGPAVTLVPRQGATAWRGDAALASSPSGLRDPGPSNPPPVARLRSLTRAEGSAGGPLGGSRLFASAALTRSTHMERSADTGLPGNVASVYAHLGARDGAVADWTVSGWAQQVTRPFEGRARFANSNVREHDRYIGIAAGWQQAGRLPFRIDAGAQSMRLSTDAPATAAQGTIERLRDGPVQELVAETPGTSSRVGANASVTPEPAGRHTIRAGVSTAYAGINATPFGSGPIGETVAGVPSRAWSFGYAGQDSRHEFTLAAHGTDRIDLGEHLSLEAGVRAEHVSASNERESIGWTTIAPSGSVSYAPGDWQLFASARRYHSPPTLNLLAFGDPSGPSGSVGRWTDANGDRIVQQNELGPVIAFVGPGSGPSGRSSIDARLRRPHIDEALAGVERRFGTHWSVRFSGVTRRKRDVIGAVNTGVPFDAYTVNYVFDPGLDLGGSQDDQMLPIYSRPAATFGNDRYLLTNVPSVTATYSALYLGAEARGYDRWYLLAGAAALRTKAPAAYRGFGPIENDDGLVGDAFSDPNSATYAMGRLLFDRGYAAKIAASYRAPHGIVFGTVARYEDGQPFARLVMAPDLPQGPDVVRAYPNGASRFTYTLTLDVRVAKDFIFVSSRLAIALDAFNALNTQNEVEENVLTGPSWRAPTAVQPPRVIRVGVRVSF